MKKVDEILMNHKIMPKYLGYKYLKYILVYELNNISDLRMETLYNNTAKRFNATRSRVERNIRTAFNKSDLKETNKAALSTLQLELFDDYVYKN